MPLWCIYRYVPMSSSSHAAPSWLAPVFTLVLYTRQLCLACMQLSRCMEPDTES